jgi:predicted NBD/HSP70 family sugar kinase
MNRPEKVVFENQNNFRVLNQIRLVAELQKGPQSFTALSEKLSLSITAIAKIVKELCRSGLTKLVSSDPFVPKKAGRRPNYVALNTAMGLIAAIDLSNRDLTVALAELNNQILLQDVLEGQDLITADSLAKIADKLRTLLASKEAAGRPLLGICISSPGKIDPEGNYIYAHRIADYQHVNLKQYFSTLFGVDVDVYHDVKLGCIGERVFGAIPKEARNIYFAYIDNAAGSSLFLNGHLYGGAHGLAGEVNDIAPIDEVAAKSEKGTFSTLEDIREDIKNQLKDVAEHPLKGKAHIHVEEMAKLYRKHDPYVEKALERSAQENALSLLAMANLLDVDAIVIQGRVELFGEDYRALLEHYFHAYDLNHNTASILFSSLKNQANLLGAIYQGCNLYWLRRFGELTAARTSSDNYDVSQYFGDNI